MTVLNRHPATPFAEAIATPFSTIAGELQKALGQRLVAYVARMGNSKNVGRWANGTGPRQNEVETRVRSLYRVLLLLRPVLSDEGIRAWLLSANPELQDAAPIDRLRDDDAPTAVLAAAEDFLALIG